MKTKLAVWYMETAWVKMGILRQTRIAHKAFNLAYSARKAEYLAQIMALPVQAVLVIGLSFNLLLRLSAVAVNVL